MGLFVSLCSRFKRCRWRWWWWWFWRILDCNWSLSWFACSDYYTAYISGIEKAKKILHHKVNYMLISYMFTTSVWKKSTMIGHNYEYCNLQDVISSPRLYSELLSATFSMRNMTSLLFSIPLCEHEIRILKFLIYASVNFSNSWHLRHRSKVKLN